MYSVLQYIHSSYQSYHTRWYLGELNEEAGRTVLETSGKYNVFIVHKTDDGGYILSARYIQPLPFPASFPFN